MFWKFLSKFKCKVFICCKSKCSINDVDRDGIPDEIVTQVFGNEIRLAKTSQMSIV